MKFQTGKAKQVCNFFQCTNHASLKLQMLQIQGCSDFELWSSINFHVFFSFGTDSDIV